MWHPDRNALASFIGKCKSYCLLDLLSSGVVKFAIGASGIKGTCTPEFKSKENSCNLIDTFVMLVKLA